MAYQPNSANSAPIDKGDVGFGRALLFLDEIAQMTADEKDKVVLHFPHSGQMVVGGEALENYEKNINKRGVFLLRHSEVSVHSVIASKDKVETNGRD